MGNVESPLSPIEERVVRHDDFRPVLRALTRAQGFAMYFAESNLPAYCRRVADALRARLDREVADVDLSDVDRSPERPTIDYILEGRLEDVPDDAVAFVWGLEHLLPSTDVDDAVTEQTLTEVNWRRGAYERLQRPLVFWLPEYAVRYLAREAPDFFDWNSGLYVFDAPDDERADLLEASLLHLDGDAKVESLSVPDKRAREAYLRALKDEYDGDSDLDRAARANVLLRLGRLYASRNEYAHAVEALTKALSIYEEIGDRSGAASTLAQLGILSVKGFDRVETGLRLLLLSHLMLSGIGHAQQQTAWDWVVDLASRLDWSQDDLAAAAQDVQAAYEDDGGWGLVRAAFEGEEG